MNFLLLAESADKVVQRISIPESLLYALIGFVVTFLGIAILIFFVWAMGKVMGVVNSRKSEKSKETSPEPAVETTAEDGISEEIKVAIIAAIAAYYDGENTSCEFKVKRIRRS